ncbi:hypothetical protein BJ508DRAFT_303084 [Ascobolus immersus RN42]|uniref:Uncharacterized protein n=1 Tax=Ascobolus immersus RN42 TaxID=1160509 RepID=A0A3N4IHD4_ASCIM|nr:hypothetical protein BJ508DRAFT_303084 [Ascobolus immersus RN42]
MPLSQTFRSRVLSRLPQVSSQPIAYSQQREQRQVNGRLDWRNGGQDRLDYEALMTQMDDGLEEFFAPVHLPENRAPLHPRLNSLPTFPIRIQHTVGLPLTDHYVLRHRQGHTSSGGDRRQGTGQQALARHTTNSAPSIQDIASDMVLPELVQSEPTHRARRTVIRSRGANETRRTSTQAQRAQRLGISFPSSLESITSSWDRQTQTLSGRNGPYRQEGHQYHVGEMRASIARDRESILQAAAKSARAMSSQFTQDCVNQQQFVGWNGVDM